MHEAGRITGNPSVILLWNGCDHPPGNPRAKGDNHSTSVALADHEIISFQCQLDTLLYHGRSSLPMLPELPITETIDEMIVYHSNGLHVGIHDPRTNETESTTLKVLAERIGFDRSCWDLSHDLPPVKLWLSVNEAPAIGVEASKLFLDFEKRACLAHGGLNLHTVANDLRI